MLLDELKPCVCPLSAASSLYLTVDPGKVLLLMKEVHVKAGYKDMMNTTDI